MNCTLFDDSLEVLLIVVLAISISIFGKSIFMDPLTIEDQLVPDLLDLVDSTNFSTKTLFPIMKINSHKDHQGYQMTDCPGFHQLF